MKKISEIFKVFFKNRWRAVLAVVLVVVLGVIVFRLLKKNNQESQVQTQRPERGTIVSSISTSGQAISSNFVNVNTQASGIVKSIFVKDGDKVRAGQKLIELDLDPTGKQSQASAWSSYLSAKNSLESAKTTLYTLDSSMWAANQKFINDAVARNLLTYDPTYIQQHDDWLAAEAKYKNQQNVILQSQIALNNTWLAYQQSAATITAPTSGTVSGLNVAEGMILSGGSSQRVAVIKNEAHPLASFNLSEMDVLKVKPGQKATITIDSLSGKTFTGTVSTVDKIGSVTSNVTNYPVIIKFDTDVPELLPNMAVSASIIIESKDNVLMVPSAAIQSQAGEALVRVLKNGKIGSIPVETGISSDTQTEIVSGLSENDEVVVSVTSTSSQSDQGTSSPFGIFGGSRGGSQMMIRR